MMTLNLWSSFRNTRVPQLRMMTWETAIYAIFAYFQSAFISSHELHTIFHSPSIFPFWERHWFYRNNVLSRTCRWSPLYTANLWILWFYPIELLLMRYLSSLSQCFHHFGHHSSIGGHEEKDDRIVWWRKYRQLRQIASYFIYTRAARNGLPCSIRPLLQEEPLFRTLKTRTRHRRLSWTANQ